MRFNTYYWTWSIILFLIELYIALHIDDNFIRPYIGDLLVVILIYTIVRALFKVSILTTAIGVLIFSFAVEVLQYFRIVERLGLGSSSLARTVIGTTFSWEDLVAYSLGILILLCFERSIGPYTREWYFVK